MQRRHEPMLGFERNHVQPRPVDLHYRRRKPGLHRQSQQRALGGIASQHPVLFLSCRLASLHSAAASTSAAAAGEWAANAAASTAEPCSSRLPVGAYPAPRRPATGRHRSPPARSSRCASGCRSCRADHRHRTQRLHRRQPTDHRVACGHTLHTDRGVMVAIAGSPSGIAATDRPTAAMNISPAPMPRTSVPNRNSNPPVARMKRSGCGRSPASFAAAAWCPAPPLRACGRYGRSRWRRRWQPPRPAPGPG